MEAAGRPNRAIRQRLLLRRSRTSLTKSTAWFAASRIHSRKNSGHCS